MPFTNKRRDGFRGAYMPDDWDTEISLGIARFTGDVKVSFDPGRIDPDAAGKKRRAKVPRRYRFPGQGQHSDGRR